MVKGISGHAIRQGVRRDKCQVKGGTQADQVSSPLRQIVVFCDRLVKEALEDMLSQSRAVGGALREVEMLTKVDGGRSDQVEFLRFGIANARRQRGMLNHAALEGANGIAGRDWRWPAVCSDGDDVVVQAKILANGASLLVESCAVRGIS